MSTDPTLPPATLVDLLGALDTYECEQEDDDSDSVDDDDRDDPFDDALLAPIRAAVAKASTKELVSAPFAIGNNLPSWHQASQALVLAAAAILDEVLRRDPENRSALWLYVQEDFLARLNRARPNCPRVDGPPIAIRPEVLAQLDDDDDLDFLEA